MKLSTLQDTGAAELGMKSSEVRTRVRYAREAGFFQSGPRGPGSPEMGKMDLAAFALAMISFSEPTSSGAALAELRRASFQRCEWTDLDAMPGEGKRNRFYPAPLSPAFGESLQLPDSLTCLAQLLEVAGRDPERVSIEALRCVSDADGMTIEADYVELASPAELRARFVAFTGDRSDGFAFPDRQDPGKWLMSFRFQLIEPQCDRRRLVLEIPGEILSRLARAVLRETA